MVFLSQTLSDMKDNLQKFSKKWGSMIHLNRSKISIFREGGRLSNQKNWKWEDRPIEIVIQFKYLEVTLTPHMSWRTQAVDKVIFAT